MGIFDRIRNCAIRDACFASGHGKTTAVVLLTLRFIFFPEVVKWYMYYTCVVQFNICATYIYILEGTL